MGVKVARHINISNRCAEYGDDGYFIEPHIIGMMLFDELKLPKVEEFVNGASITITEDEIKEFLSKKMDEEQPGLKQKLGEEMKTSSIISFTSDEKENRRKIDASIRKMKDMTTAYRYYFEPYSLQYFKIYTSRLREKVQSLFSVLNDIDRCKSEELSEESKQRLKDLDFHINSKGNLYFKDAERLADVIIDNVKDLCEKVNAGNNPETYLTFKDSKHSLMKDDIWPSEIYPRKEIQIKDRYYAHRSGFIALSEAQQTQVQKEALENFSRWMKMDFEEDDCENEKGPTLQKVKEENKQKKIAY